MKQRLSALLGGEGVKARVFRGTGLTVVNYGTSNLLRLVSNLVLTRLLFPEAFGLMSLIQVFISGLELFSDTGIGTSVIRSKRGDEREYLDTAWTISVVRSVIIWLMTCILAVPVSRLYDEPMLAWLMPIVGLNAIIAGLTPTKAVTANRHLKLGRLTMINITNQVISIVITVTLAYFLRSVLALVIGGLISATLRNLQIRYRMPGQNNRFHWDRSAFDEMFHFGKWIFVSTAAGFFINQGDRAILGAYITLAELGIYNIGFFLANVPFGLSQAINSKVLFPLYRLKPPAESRRNQRNVFKMRRLVTAGLFSINLVLTFFGVYIVEFLYDDRYHLAGPIVTLVSVTLVPKMVLTAYGRVLLANGDSRSYTILLGVTAGLQLVLLFAGLTYFGLFGAILAPGLAALLVYPLRVASVRRYKAWDPLHDAVFLGLGAVAGAIACWLYWGRIAELLP